jgi:dTDP-4-amino-4,6-dideoxygalactose transaminase
MSTKKESMEDVVRAPYGSQLIRMDQKSDIPYAFPRVMGPNCMKYLREVIDSGLTSDMVERFEHAFAQAVGMKHCVATPGCTPALAVIAAALPFEPGDEIIVSPVTDFGTIQGLCRENYIPVFPDTRPGTVNMSAETIEPCITDRTRAILVVHKTGIVCDMDPINALAEEHGLFVYEDACQAIFGRYKGRLVGTLSQATVFSFDPEKTMGSDVGGAIVTNDGELSERMRFVGQSRGGQMVPHFGRMHTECGYAYRMSQSTAAVSLAQLEVIGDQVANRDRMIRLIYEELAKISGITPLPIPDYLDVYSCWMAGFSVDPQAFRCSPEDFAQQLDQEGIVGAGLARYYLMPVGAAFLQRQAESKVYPFSIPPASREYAYRAEDCPNAYEFLETFIRWIISERYTQTHCERIVSIVQGVADRNRV